MSKYKITLIVSFSVEADHIRGGIQATQELWNAFCGKLAEADIYRVDEKRLFDHMRLLSHKSEVAEDKADA